MTEPPDESVAARVRPTRISWIWAVPVIAALIVAWLAWRSLVDRGPEITISFKTAEGLQAGQSTIQHRNVVVGTVESLELTEDLSQVLVHARMTSAAEPYLTANTRFYIVAPRVSPTGISGLSTLVSGSYIEMAPAKGDGQQRHFVGLEEPLIQTPDTPGKMVTLKASELGSLSRGARISYHGLLAGQVQSYVLDEEGRQVIVKAFIHAPYDRFVHADTRFWNAGGVDLSLGAQGVQIRAASWQQLLAGGIAFDSPADDKTPQPAADAVFKLYEDRASAERSSRKEQLFYVADFAGDLRGLKEGLAVELLGNDIGTVKEVHVEYRQQRPRLVTRAIIGVDVDSVKILDMPQTNDREQVSTVRHELEQLITQGLQARVTTANFLTDAKVISLTLPQDAPSTRVERVGDYTKIPTAPAADISEILESLHGVLNNIDRATAGPELTHAVKSLDNTLTRLDRITQDVEPDLKPLIKSLRDTADAAQSTLASVHDLIGDRPLGNAEVARLMRELTQAAQAVRGLADYLDRHPEALLRGRKEATP